MPRSAIGVTSWTTPIATLARRETTVPTGIDSCPVVRVNIKVLLLRQRARAAEMGITRQRRAPRFVPSARWDSCAPVRIENRSLAHEVPIRIHTAQRDANSVGKVGRRRGVDPTGLTEPFSRAVVDRLLRDGIEFSPVSALSEGTAINFSIIEEMHRFVSCRAMNVHVLIKHRWLADQVSVMAIEISKTFSAPQVPMRTMTVPTRALTAPRERTPRNAVQCCARSVRQYVP